MQSRQLALNTPHTNTRTHTHIGREGSVLFTYLLVAPFLVFDRYIYIYRERERGTQRSATFTTKSIRTLLLTRRQKRRFYFSFSFLFSYSFRIHDDLINAMI